MSFEPVYVYDGDGNFIGSSIHKSGSQKLHTANLWKETPEDVEDFNAQLTRLRDQADVLAFWPDSSDPEVTALIDDPTWEPLSKESIEVVDEDKSVFIWEEAPDSRGNPSGTLDEEQSSLVYKTIEVSTDLAEAQRRVKKAHETGARNRAQKAATA